MHIRAIILTSEGDELILPEQPRVLYNRAQEVPARRSVLEDSDLEALEIGKYPMEGFRPMNSRMIGSPSHYVAYDILGKHSACGSNMVLKNISSSHQAIICDKCYLRVPVPHTVKTYGQLLGYMEKNVHKPLV